MNQRPLSSLGRAQHVQRVVGREEDNRKARRLWSGHALGQPPQLIRAGTTTWLALPSNRVTPSTGSPTFQPVTPSPSASTWPQNSKPGVMGQPTYFFADA